MSEQVNHSDPRQPGPSDPGPRIGGVYWATDVPISMPVPVDNTVPILVPMGGFGFTADGLKHDMTQSDLEELFTPFFMPETGFNA